MNHCHSGLFVALVFHLKRLAANILPCYHLFLALSVNIAAADRNQAGRQWRSWLGNSRMVWIPDPGDKVLSNVFTPLDPWQIYPSISFCHIHGSGRRPAKTAQWGNEAWRMFKYSNLAGSQGLSNTNILYAWLFHWKIKSINMCHMVRKQLRSCQGCEHLNRWFYMFFIDGNSDNKTSMIENLTDWGRDAQRSHQLK